ncbi:hypothetical protein AAX19_03185 [Oenococcus oeni]|nr:hypothetical protein AAX19_03185 [Oenococcus oeni]
MYMKYSNDLYPHVIGIQFWSSVIATIGIFANIFFIGQIINLLLKNGHSDKIPILMTVLFLIVLLLLNLFSEYLGVLAKSGSHMMLKKCG